jgi:hypothetical protein
MLTIVCWETKIILKKIKNKAKSKVFFKLFCQNAACDEQNLMLGHLIDPSVRNISNIDGSQDTHESDKVCLTA